MKRLRELREELLASVDRWIPEIHNAPARSTVRIGIAQKCYSSIDQILDNCVREAIPICGAVGKQTLTICGKGKPPDLLTLGQRVEILAQLDDPLSIALPIRFPGVHTERPLLGKKGASLLRTICRKRIMSRTRKTKPTSFAYANFFVTLRTFVNLNLFLR
jgi:hypothetical protein